MGIDDDNGAGTPAGPDDKPAAVSIRWWIAVMLCEMVQAVIPPGHYITVGKPLPNTPTWP